MTEPDPGGLSPPCGSRSARETAEPPPRHPEVVPPRRPCTPLLLQLFWELCDLVKKQPFAAERLTPKLRS